MAGHGPVGPGEGGGGQVRIRPATRCGLTWLISLAMISASWQMRRWIGPVDIAVPRGNLTEIGVVERAGRRGWIERRPGQVAEAPGLLSRRK